MCDETANFETTTNEFVWTKVNTIECKHTAVKLNARLEQIHLAELDTSVEPKQQ